MFGRTISHRTGNFQEAVARSTFVLLKKWKVVARVTTKNQKRADEIVTLFCFGVSLAPGR
jgi:hypothetical protein